MANQIIYPDFAGSFLKGMQAGDSITQFDDARAWENEQRERQRKEWQVKDNALLKAKQDRLASDAAQIYSRLNPDDPGFDQEFDLAADWFSQRNSEGAEMVTKIKALPTEQRKAYIKQARLQLNLSKPNDYTLKPGEVRFDQFGEKIADGGPVLHKLGPGQEMKSPDGKMVIKGPPPAPPKPKQDRESSVALWIREQKKFKKGSREWNFYQKKLDGSGSGGGGLGGGSQKYDPDVIRYYADQLRSTGKLAITGYGKDMSEMKRLVYNEAARLDIEEGRSGRDAAYDATDRKAIQGSIAAQEKQYGSMTSFVVNLADQVDHVKSVSKEIRSFDARLVNKPIWWVKKHVAGDPQLSKYGLYLGEIQSEIGKLSSGSTASVAELSKGARKKWESVLDENMSVNDMLKVLEEVKRAGNIRLRSVEVGLDKSRQRLLGIGGGGGKKPATTTMPKKKPVQPKKNTTAKVKHMSDDDLFKIINGGK